jgi:WD40 repeat protein
MRSATSIALVIVLCVAGPMLAQQKKPDVVAKLEGHRGGVSAIAYSAKGDRIATGSGNGVVRLWDAKTGELVSRVDQGKHGSARVASVAFSADGNYLSSSSRTMTGAWDITDPKRLSLRYEDPFGSDPGKLGTVSGDGQLMYFTGIENMLPVLSAYTFGNRSISKLDLPAKLRPVAMSAISDSESALVAVHCAMGEKGESAAVALVGLGETRVLTKDVPAPSSGKPTSIAFAPDAKWLVVGNGSKVACWRVPGSQVISSDPIILPGAGHFVSCPGPRNVVVVASGPANGRAVLVTLYDLGGTEPKRLADYNSGLTRISTLAFSPDGAILAVGDDDEGIVQLWALK